MSSGRVADYSPDVREIEVLGQPERADAARNRLKVLAAAQRLFTRHGVAGVSMDDIAAEAGVGKGTLYRRFGDKGGLAIALLDEQERRLQEAILTGEPPLGPGAPPRDRVTAFVRAYCEFLDGNGDLVLLSEHNSIGARFETGAYRFWRLHLANLLDGPHPVLRAELLLAPLSAENYRELRTRHEVEDLISLLVGHD